MKSVTKVTWTRGFKKQLASVPHNIREKVFYWVYVVELRGIAEVRKTTGYHDEPLQGQRWGQRSIRLNRSYRLIYRALDGQIQIELLEVHKHDY